MELALTLGPVLALDTKKAVGTEYCWLEAVMTGNEGSIGT